MASPHTLPMFTARLFGNLPVKILRGTNRGLWWTLYPWSAYWRGCADETDTVAAIQAHVNAGDVCFDLGAHFGFYTLMMAQRAGNQGHVYCFEPEPFSFAKLQRHVRLNRFSSRCTAFNTAASKSDGSGRMFSDGGGATTTHFRYIDEPTFGADGALSVRTVRIDTLVSAGKVQLPNFIKVDVEGHAAEALAGAIETIKSSRPVVLLSTHGINEARDIGNFFSLLGYSARWSVSGGLWEAEHSRAEEGVLMIP